MYGTSHGLGVLSYLVASATFPSAALGPCHDVSSGSQFLAEASDFSGDPSLALLKLQHQCCQISRPSGIPGGKLLVGIHTFMTAPVIPGGRLRFYERLKQVKIITSSSVTNYLYRINKSLNYLGLSSSFLKWGLEELISLVLSSTNILWVKTILAGVRKYEVTFVIFRKQF